MNTWTPRQYQKDLVQKMLDNESHLIFADPGLGKTAVALSAFEQMKEETMLVVAPKRVALTVWPAEIKKWEFELECSIIVGTKAHCIEAAMRTADVYVVNPERLAWLLDFWSEEDHLPWNEGDRLPQVLVIDESTKFKAGRKAKRFQALSEYLLCFDRRYCLTGTPAPNSLEDLWAQAFIADLGHTLGPNITQFRNRFFYSVGQYYSDWRPNPGAAEVIYELLEDLVTRLDHLDHLDIPDLLINDIDVELPADARVIYDEMERQFIIEMEKTPIVAVSAAVATTKLRQIANGRVYDEEKKVHKIHTAKQEALEGLLEQIHEPVIIVYEYQHDLLAIHDALVPNSTFEILGGGRTHDFRVESVIRTWNRGELDYLIVHPASAGHGLSLQHGGHHVIFYGLTWNLEHYTQTIARLWRSGQEHKVIVHRLIAFGTVDDDVCKALDRKGAVQKDLLDALKERVR